MRYEVGPFLSPLDGCTVRLWVLCMQTVWRNCEPAGGERGSREKTDLSPGMFPCQGSGRSWRDCCLIIRLQLLYCQFFISGV